MKFEGRNYDIIEGPPAHKWEEQSFYSDWRSGVDNRWLNEKEKEIVLETVLKPLYKEYEGLLDLIEGEKGITKEQIERMIRRLNSAMGNIIEFGKRDNQHIISSLNDKKYGASWPEEEVKDIFDPLIDMLIKSFEEATREFDLNF